MDVLNADVAAQHRLVATLDAGDRHHRAKLFHDRRQFVVSSQRGELLQQAFLIGIDQARYRLLEMPNLLCCV